MILRAYQRDAVESVYGYLNSHEGNPCVVIPTGGGKTPVLATICNDVVSKWGGRVVVLAHVKELLQQATEKLRTIAPEVPVGVYSAGLGSRDLGYAVTVAGIQSVYKRAEELGKINLIIIDEAHIIPTDGEGMYRTFIAAVKEINPKVRIVGLTATPYRMKSGTICGPDNILNEVCYEVGVRQLIDEGFICPLRSKAGAGRPDTSELHTRAGEFVTDEVEKLMDDADVVKAACKEIVTIAQHRKSVLIFCSSVAHGKHVARTIGELDKHCGFICGDTSKVERFDQLVAFKRGTLKYLANVNVLTTGFDAPNIDLVAMLRPTLSPGLYYQMVGRGFRMCDDKADCIVLDYGGNVMRHGPVDAIVIREPGEPGSGDAPARECPECEAIVHAGYAVCPECGFVFPLPEKEPHDATASDNGVITGEETSTDYEVQDVCYFVHQKRGDEAAPLTMRVEYRIGFEWFVKEWVCFDHYGYARTKAEQWWRLRSDEPVPTSTVKAVDMAMSGSLAEPWQITVTQTTGERWERVTDYKLGKKQKDWKADKYVGIPDDCPF